jgi:hypothetical protein
MTYKEVKHSNGSFRRVWRDENGYLHREDGPAIVWYNSDGSISEGKFSLNGELIGYNEEGFWALWDNLTEEQRKNPELLKYLVRFS